MKELEAGMVYFGMIIGASVGEPHLSNSMCPLSVDVDIIYIYICPSFWSHGWSWFDYIRQDRVYDVNFL